MKLLLRGGRLIDPALRLDTPGDVLIANGRIEAVGTATASDARVVDVEGCWVSPGLVDLHSVVRDEADLQAALAGGFTTVIGAPESSLLRSELLDYHRAAPLTRALEGVELGEVPIDALCLSQGFRALPRASVLRRALQYSPRTLLVLHAEDPSLTAGGVLGEGLTATRLGIPSVPAVAESSIVARDLELLAETGGRIHFAHVTTARTVDLLRSARARGLQVSADVTPHHLTRDTTSAEGYSLDARVWPPLRSAADLEALRVGLRDGTIDAIACDHVTVDSLEREHAFEACAPGLAAFAHAIPVALSLGLSPGRVVEVLSSGPARLVGLPRRLEAGALAHLTVIDPVALGARGVVVGQRHSFQEGRS